MELEKNISEWVINRISTIFNLTIHENTSFDQLGIDSIISAGILNDISNKYKIVLTFEDLDNCKTINDLCILIKSNCQ